MNMAENCKDSRPLFRAIGRDRLSYLSHKQLKSLPFSPLSHVRSDLAIHLDKVTPRYGKRIVTTVCGYTNSRHPRQTPEITRRSR